LQVRRLQDAKNVFSFFSVPLGQDQFPLFNSDAL